MVKALIRVHQYLQNPLANPCTDYRCIMTIHDELDFDFPIHPINLKHIQHLKALMEQSGQDLGLPTPVDVSWHPETWAKGLPLSEYKHQPSKKPLRKLAKT